MTAQNIIDEAKLDFPDESDTRALSDLQSVWDALCQRYRIITSTEDVSLTAGTAEYSLPTDTIRVHVAYYVTSATQYSRLEATHRDALDEYYPNWRGQASGTPFQYYVDVPSGKLGLYPKPDTTTSTYPKVVIDVNKKQTLSVGTTLSGNLPSYQACVEGVKARMALRVQDARLQAYDYLYKQEVMLLDRVLRGSAEFQPTYRPKLPTMFNRRKA